MSNVLVAVRVRPMNTREEEQRAKVAVKIESNIVQVTNFKVPNYQDHDSRARTKNFTFDFCYWTADRSASNYASQKMIYEDLGGKVLDAIFSGFNACVLAYGQSGTGKTYTMLGHNDDLGLVPRICQELFQRMANMKEPNLKFRTEVSFLEIYNEGVSDLLAPRCHSKKSIKQTLRVREHPKTGPCVQDLSKHLVSDYNAVQTLLDKGIQNRNIAATKMHDHSSRSHAIFTIIFTQARLDTDLPSEIISKIQLVDLAGSERAGVHTSKIRLKEGANINKSLVALGSVISTLADRTMLQGNLSTSPTSRGNSRRGSGVGGVNGVGGQQHFVPYRDSVLTWLLKDSLGGNSKTIMVATISPASTAYNETVNTLRYAQRAKCIVNKPIINEDPKVKLIRELRLEVQKLRELLANAQKAIGNNLIVTDMINKNEDKAEELTRVWIGKWNEFRQQEQTCISCANKLQTQIILSRDCVSCAQQLTSREINISEEHVQTVYKDQGLIESTQTIIHHCIHCNQSISTDDEQNDLQDSPILEINLSDLSSEKLDDYNETYKDGWLSTDEFSYVHNVESELSRINYISVPVQVEKLLSPISENESFVDSLDNIDTESVEANANQPQIILLNEIGQNEKHFSKLYNYSSDSDVEQDSLDEHETNKSNSVKNKIDIRLISNQFVNKQHELEHCQPEVVWTSLSYEQPNSEFAYLQPLARTIQATLSHSNSSLHSVVQETVLKCEQYTNLQTLSVSSQLLSVTDSATNSNVADKYNDSTSSNSSNYIDKPITYQIKRKVKAMKNKTSKRSVFDQQLQAIKRRRRRKLAVKCSQTTSQSEESVDKKRKNEKYENNTNLPSPPPLPRPPFLNGQLENSNDVVKCDSNSLINSESRCNENNTVENQNSYSPLTSWKDVNTNRGNQPSVPFDCTSTINGQSWPSCDSLTMVYIGPKWNSNKENFINSIDNLEDIKVDDDDQQQTQLTNLDNKSSRQQQTNLVYSDFWLNNYSLGDRHIRHDCCSCKNLSPTQRSGNWNDFPNQTDSIMNCAEVSTQTDSGISGIQTDHSVFQPEMVNHCNWSYSTIEGQSQSRIVTVDSSIQTEAIKCHITAQTDPMTNSVGLQTDPEICSTEVQSIMMLPFCNSVAENDHFMSKFNNCVDDDNIQKPNITWDKKVEANTLNSHDDVDEIKLTKVTPALSHGCTSFCESGVYIGFHGICNLLTNVKVNVSLGDISDGKKTVMMTNNKNVEVPHMKSDLQGNEIINCLYKTILEPPDEFKEIPENNDDKTCALSKKFNKTSQQNTSEFPVNYTINTVQSSVPNAIKNHTTPSKELREICELADRLTPIMMRSSSPIIDLNEDISHKCLPNTNPFISMDEDEYYQLPIFNPFHTTNTKMSYDDSIRTERTCTCTCENRKSDQNRFKWQLSYEENEELSPNLPEDICQLLQECKEVRMKAWQEIMLAQQQLRLATNCKFEESQICAVHGFSNS